METEHGNNEKRKAAASEAAETKLRFSQSLEHACCTGMTVFEEAGSHFSATSGCVEDVPAVNLVLRNVLIETNYISKRDDSSSLCFALLSHTLVAWPSHEALEGKCV